MIALLYTIGWLIAFAALVHGYQLWLWLQKEAEILDDIDHSEKIFNLKLTRGGECVSWGC